MSEFTLEHRVLLLAYFPSLGGISLGAIGVFYFLRELPPASVNRAMLLGQAPIPYAMFMFQWMMILMLASVIAWRGIDNRLKTIHDAIDSEARTSAKAGSGRA